MNDFTRARGFTLIEVLVAFTIAATSLGLLFRIHSSSASTVVLGEEYLQATELAQSVVDESDATERHWTFARTGVMHDKFAWTARGESYGGGAAAASGVDAPGYGLRRIDVEVVWQSRGKERRVELNTVRTFFSGPEP